MTCRAWEWQKVVCVHVCVGAHVWGVHAYTCILHAHVWYVCTRVGTFSVHICVCTHMCMCYVCICACVWCVHMHVVNMCVHVRCVSVWCVLCVHGRMHVGCIVCMCAV